MQTTSKDLLELEAQKPSFLESTFLVGNKDPLTQTEDPHSKRNVDGKLITTPVPKSQVLGKVKDFLGVMAEANKRMQLDAQENSCEVYDIEVLNGNESKYIEMDLLLGVADLNTPEAIVAAESAMAGSMSTFPVPVCCSDSDTDDTDDSDDDDDNDDITCSRDKTQNESLDKNYSSTDRQKKQPKITELH